MTRVGDLAAGQWGMFTSAQAGHRGLSAQHLARLAKEGTLERVRHGVYRSAAAPSSAHDSLRAAWLALEPGLTAHERVQADDVEAVSHRSAALVHQLGDVEADHLEFTTATRKQTRDPQVRFHRRSLRPDQWTLVEGLAVTTAATTIADLAASRLDGGHLGGVVRDALTTVHLDLDDVAAALAPHAHLYGVGPGQGRQLVQLLLEQAGVPRSTQDVARLLDPALPVRALQEMVNAIKAIDFHELHTVSAGASQQAVIAAMADVDLPVVAPSAMREILAALMAVAPQTQTPRVASAVAASLEQA